MADDDIDPALISSSRYDDFHTIDWQRDLARDRLRHKYLVRRRESGGISGWFDSLMDASSGWILVLLVGISAGKYLQRASAHSSACGTQAPWLE
jgi:chloride channel 3/4/5